MKNSRLIFHRLTIFEAHRREKAISPMKLTFPFHEIALHQIIIGDSFMPLRHKPSSTMSATILLRRSTLSLQIMNTTLPETTLVTRTSISYKI